MIVISLVLEHSCLCFDFPIDSDVEPHFLMHSSLHYPGAQPKSRSLAIPDGVNLV